ncbi:PREDICTED: uncharacterized protein LOC108758502 [Trachymyrmex cornetzi]|uniref:uncharacterized protein LOC108758502 n=1 Tax=Trachymyrmex cornetzi TaxID=471704 RepID=UPI00084F4371|nr:PREDICTED: uncharacterized protein LOC108758502 [Trachymyrmex cornetzi]
MMKALTVFLLCLTSAYAVSVHFPAEKTLIYNYYADVKAGTVEPAQYVSQFALTGQLHVKKDTSDPTLNNAYYIKLNNLKYGMYNGMVVHHQPVKVLHELGEAAQQIQEPFVIVYDESSKLQGIKMPETESGWSRNIKQGIASMLQLDLAHIQMQTPLKPHGFITHENTIHGTCQVAYDVHLKNSTNSENTNVFVVTKMHDLRNCSHFVQRAFDYFECEKCHMESVDDITTFARRVFEIKRQDNEIFVERLVAHSTINYFPYNSRSESHYLLTNTTLDLHSIVPTTEVPVLAVQNVPIIRDITFNKPLGNYALHAAEDLTHGRHIVKLDTLIPKLKKMLVEAADYLEEDHLEAKEPEWKHGQTINRLQHTMSYMDLGSLEQVYNAIQDSKTPKEDTMRNIFLRMIPTVGTTAACHFVRNVVRKHKVSDNTAVDMLRKLPMHVKVPSERLLLEMEDLLKLGSTVSPQVRKASILCFSILIRKTFMHQQSDIINPLLERYLHRFFDHVKNEQSYEMKVIYLMAMRNVQVGNIEKLLEPIIRGEVMISEYPYHIRAQAIWAIKKAVSDRVEYTHNLLWPILADVTQPLSIRIVAYETLMSQMPDMQRIMNIYWLMTQEPNNHLYNYHLTTLKGLANSVDPCLTPIREMARKVLRFTRIRPVTTQLSSKQFVDYTDPMYEFGESWNTAWILEESTGTPYAGYFEYHNSLARKPTNRMGIYWSSHGLDEIMKVVKKELIGTSVNNLTNKNVQNILIRAAQDMPMKKPVHLDICITLNGLVVLFNHYDQNTFKNMFDDAYQALKQTVVGNIQEILYDTLYEVQVPTDMGLQGVFNTKMPQLWSFKFNNVQNELKKPSMNLKLDVDTRIWRHGEYVMSIYNPIVDVWHSVRRATVQDIILPMQMSIGYNHEAKSLKITLPRLPVTKQSITGIRSYSKNLVTITEDEQDVLKTCCADCLHHTVVTTGEKKNRHVTMDSKDVGLKYSMSVFDCENEITQMTNAEEWQRVFSAEHKNTWNSKLLQYYMGIRQRMMNEYALPKMGNCGTLLKMEPSIVYPTSHVDLNIRINVEDVDHIHEKIYTLSSNKINVRATLDAKAASTNESIRSWDMNVNVDLSPGHLVNNFKIQMTRETPGEKNLKICLDAQKNYPVVETDPLKIDTTKEETNNKISITAGFTDDDKCVRDDMMIVMTLKGEMTEEQKRQMTHNNMHGACVKDTQNLQFQNKLSHIPKTMNCVRETLHYTTLKKYTINTTYKKVPVQILSYLAMIEDYIRASHLSYVRYLVDRVESGNAKIMIEYSSDLSHVNTTIVTPVNGYEYVQVPLQQHLFEGMVVDRPVSHPQWHSLMDNTRFSVGVVHKLMQGQTKICTVYPQALVTLDEGVIPFVVFDKWTLVSADHIDWTYAVFVKSVQGTKLAIKMYVADHEMEIVPNEFNTVVTVDGNVINQHEKGVVIPKDEPKSYALKLTENYGHLVIQSQRVPILMMWTPDSVSVILDTTLQGHVTGVCGHMDGTHKEKLPKIYTVMNL